MQHSAAAAAVPIAVRAGSQRRAASQRAQPQRRLASAPRSSPAAPPASFSATTTMALSLPAAVAIPVLGGFGVATRMDHQAREPQQHAQNQKHRR